MTANAPTLAATIVIPTTAGRGPLLPQSIGSVLAQTVTDIEIFIIGDGVDDPTRAVIGAQLRKDPRLRFFDHPKHPRRGEPHRHAALAEARGKIVCYLCDRDLMRPDHVAAMTALLTDADFAHSLILAVVPDGSLRFATTIDLANAADRAWTATTWTVENGIPLSFAAHTLAMYRRLPFGWRTTPDGHFTDIYMWQQILSDRNCRARSGTRPTVLYFPRYWRNDWTAEAKVEELSQWAGKYSGEDGDSRLTAFVLDQLTKDRWHRAAQLRQALNRARTPSPA